MNHLDFINEEDQLKSIHNFLMPNEQDHNTLVKSDLNYCKNEAEKGNIESQEFLAMKYSKENDTENFDKYCQMLIKQGNTRIPLEYAVNLYKCQKFDQAFRYFSILSNVNHPIARYYLGIMKFYGHGCVQNKNESFNVLNELSKKAFSSTAIEELKITKHLKSIGDNAFHLCRFLRKVVKDSNSELQEIGSFAFFRTNVENIHGPYDIPYN